MGFYFCGQYIHTNGDPKEVEWKMYAAVPTFRGFYDRYGYEDWESNLETFFNYFSLTSEQKCLYARMKLVGEPYYWVENNHKLCRYWFLLQDFLRARYAPPIYSSESDYKEPNVEQETKSRSITDLYTKFRVALQKRVASQAAKRDTDPEPSALVEPDVLEEPGSEVVAELEHEPEQDNAVKLEPEPVVVDEPEPEPKIEEPLVKNSVDLTAELAMGLMTSTPAMRVPVSQRSPDLYDPLQIFLQETELQEVRLFMVRSIVDSVLILEDVPLSVTCALLELSSFIANQSQKPVPPTPPWFSLDAHLLGPRPPPWPD